MPIALWAAFACTSLVGCVTEDEPARDGDGQTDESCYEACLEKGAPADECAAWCTADDDGKPGAGDKPPTGGDDPDDGVPAQVLDPAVEKPCIECWYDETQTGGACANEAKTCEASLACTQLQWCPTLCGKAECFDECNTVIPSGVEALTA
ncbi:MAG: hypothetical protein QF464_21820, partial [Myxococcota bacterium]|nr:hypothetical protein [Myxococcota bacterium]